MNNPVLIKLDNQHSPIHAPEQWSDYFSDKMIMAFSQMTDVNEKTEGHA